MTLAFRTIKISKTSPCAAALSRTWAREATREATSNAWTPSDPMRRSITPSPLSPLPMRALCESSRAKTLFEPEICEVDSPDDPRISDYQNLKDVTLRRRIEPELGLYMAESTYVIERALGAGHAPRSFLTAAKYLPQILDVVAQLPATVRAPWSGRVPVYVASSQVLEQITGFRVHRGALAAMHRPKLMPMGEMLQGDLATGSAHARVGVLENTVDHTNVGAIFRSVAALGADAVLVTPECADPLYRRSVRVSMGTIFGIPWTRIPNWPAGIEQLRAAGFTTAALALGEQAIDITEFAAQNLDRVALVLGTEGDGLQERTLAHCDATVRIPMRRGVDS